MSKPRPFIVEKMSRGFDCGGTSFFSRREGPGLELNNGSARVGYDSWGMLRTRESMLLLTTRERERERTSVASGKI